MLCEKQKMGKRDIKIVRTRIVNKSTFLFFDCNPCLLLSKTVPRIAGIARFKPVTLTDIGIGFQMQINMEHPSANNFPFDVWGGSGGGAFLLSVCEGGNELFLRTTTKILQRFKSCKILVA